MINIALFIDTKEGELSTRSIQLFHLAQEVQRIHASDASIHVYTFANISQIDLPALSNLNLTKIEGAPVSGIFSRHQIQAINGKLIEDKINCVLGYKNILTDQLFPAFAIGLKLPLISQVISLDLVVNELHIKQNIFSGKAVSNLNATYESVLSLHNALEFANKTLDCKTISPQVFSLVQSADFTTNQMKKSTIGISLVDANFVVGAGRGLKDPSNWSIIEQLAAKIGAATACSKPVSDINWRPHSEHVGQTGIKIAPKLYIACG
ncbi:MAG: hypothetical protein RLZZ44_1165, partial [Bacteroidota bacterium]